MVCDIILNVQAIRLTYLFAEIELKKVFNLFQVATRFLASRYQKYFPYSADIFDEMGLNPVLRLVWWIGHTTYF